MVRHNGSKPQLVELCNNLSIFRLKEWGLLDKYSIATISWDRALLGRTDEAKIIVNTIDTSPWIWLIYAITDGMTGERSVLSYSVRLDTTPCHYGGVRYWFLCPLLVDGAACGRRVGKLHLPPGGRYFGCRHCHKLSHDSREIPGRGMANVFAQMMRIEEQIEKLYGEIVRWTYRGRLTRKARRVRALESQHARYISMSRRHFGLLDGSDRLHFSDESRPNPES